MKTFKSFSTLYTIVFDSISCLNYLVSVSLLPDVLRLAFPSCTYVSIGAANVLKALHEYALPVSCERYVKSPCIDSRRTVTVFLCDFLLEIKYIYSDHNSLQSFWHSVFLQISFLKCKNTCALAGSPASPASVVGPSGLTVWFSMAGSQSGG